jgi:hypothetical protein
VEHAALAAVEGEDGGVGRQAGEGLVDDRARDAPALRVARDRGQESVEFAAAWRGERGGGEEQQDEGKEEAAALPHPRILSSKTQPVISQPQGWRYVCGTSPTFPDGPLHRRFRRNSQHVSEAPKITRMTRSGPTPRAAGV